MAASLKENIKSRSAWLRGLYMLLFIIIYGVAEIVIGAVVLFQFLSRLLTGDVNKRLVGFGQSLSTFVYQIMVFLTFNSEERPYPFAPWPKGAPPVKPAPRRKRAASRSKAESAPEAKENEGETGTGGESSGP